MLLSIDSLKSFNLVIKLSLICRNLIFNGESIMFFRFTATALLALFISACGGGGGTPSVAPTITGPLSDMSVTEGATATFSAVATGTGPLRYQWSKNGSAILNATAADYTTPATVLPDSGSKFSVTVTNSAGSATSNEATLTVSVLSVACTGANCGASNPGTYSGSGIGVWRYENKTNAPASVDLKIAGVSAGKQVTLAFTNGQEAAATSVPEFGVSISSAMDLHAHAQGNRSLPSKPSHVQKHEDSHARILQMNQEVVRSLKTMGRNGSSARAAAQAGPLLFTPAVGATRDWLESGFSQNTYASTNRHVCGLPNGRNVVFWQANSDSALTSTILGTFTSAVCGTGRGFDKLMALIGDAWGPHRYNDLISDSSGKQDINIVFLPADGESWAGYFWAINSILKSEDSRSNQALVFFINTAEIAFNVDFYVSTLIHEAKHMIGFYQEALVRDKEVATWYEETSAMMSEDIVGAAVIGANKIAQYRIPAYINLGGNISLNNWPELSGGHYAMGGALGAFLNRRYGTDLFKSSVTECRSGTTKTSSYACLDQLIVSYGGLGLADEVARMGASVFSKAPGSRLPGGVGYPEINSNGYTLSAIDLTNASVSVAPTLNGYRSMTQTQLTQRVPPGATGYQRSNVVVPGKTILYVVIQ